MLGVELFIELADADSRRLTFGSEGSLQRRTIAPLLHDHGLKLPDALGRRTPQLHSSPQSRTVHCFAARAPGSAVKPDGLVDHARLAEPLGYEGRPVDRCPLLPLRLCQNR